MKLIKIPHNKENTQKAVATINGQNNPFVALLVKGKIHPPRTDPSRDILS